MVATPAPHRPSGTTKPASHPASLANLRSDRLRTTSTHSTHTPPAARRSLPCSPRLVETLPAATTAPLPPSAQRS
ncbi:hypothetical protein CGRA01v4_08677 [Colletotrichum graminicola]|nr:hypothetical protein CGRA01v4_08677 [Colletotrichum graminicola]